jgi:glc operon protein GlcG
MNTKPFFVGLLVVMCIGVSQALAQHTAEKKSLTLDGAKRAIAAAVAQAKKGAGTGAIAVVDEGGNLLAVERLDNTFAAGANISIGKARTAVLFRKPTKFFEDVVNKGRTAMTTLDDFTPLQGGVPIVIDGQVVGGIGVSGAASAQQDEEIALAGASAVGTSNAVMYYKSGDVAAAFSTGAVLFDDKNVNYQVHASRRVEPGQAEIHTRETDVIHVLAGEAVFVTGGKAIDVKQTAPDEYRGPSIEGGETRKLVPGDVIIVPAGTPHWFKQVSGELHYYVVKVS